MPRKRRDITIYRIAEEAGVSIATISRVMNRRAGVSEETRARIDRLLRQYEFAPDYPRQRSPQIAILSPGNEITGYVSNAVNGISRYGMANGLETSLILGHSEHSGSLLESIRNRQCSGAIVLMVESYHGAHAQLIDTELPIIFLDTTLQLPRTGFIDNDSYSGSASAAQHLLQLGHRKIGYLQHANPVVNHIQRFKGYENTLKAAGIAIDPKWIGQSPNTPPTGRHVRGLSGALAMRALLQRAPDITAVMAVDDGMALGAMSVIHEAGRRIPQDLSVVGFDNYPETEFWHPALTTVHHPIEEAGYQAAAAIHRALNTPGFWTPPRDILPTTLVVRQSTGPAPR